MKRIHQIALRGMKGRKKDTAALAIVITMSFLFLSVGTALLSSLTQSQMMQRMSLYGSWKLVDRYENPDLTAALEQQKWMTGSHDVQILGADESCGSVSVWNDDFARMGGLQLAEGRAPEKPGEIVLEKGQLSLFDEPIGVGSTVELTLRYPGQSSPEIPDLNIPETMEIYGITVPAEPFYKALATDVSAKAIEEALYFFVQNFDLIKQEYEQWNLTLPEMPMRLPESLDQMTQQEIRQLLDIIMEEPIFLYCMVGTNYHPIAVRTQSNVYYPSGSIGAVDWTLDSKYTLRTAASHVSGEKILQHGALEEQELTMKRVCTVVGILETTADRWDVSEITVPNAYVSEATRQELQTCVDDLTQRPRPEWFHASAETVLAQESYTFYETDLPMAEAYDRLQAISGNAVRQEPFEVLYNLELPRPNMNISEKEIREQAVKAGFAEEDIEGVMPQDPVLYYMEFGVQEDPSLRSSAYFVLPQVRVVLKDGSRSPLSWPEGYLIYQADGSWESMEVPRDTLLRTDFAPEGYRSLGYLPESLEDAYAYNAQTIGINRYAYPSERGLEATMGETLVAVIVTITVCAVFQIFFTQLRRRTRKLTLLRSIGATNGQILALLGFEGFYITLAGLLIGDGLGLLTAYFIASRLPDTVFYLDWKLFLSGQFWGILAVAAGLLLPSVQAVRAPLVGRMTGKRRRHVKIKAMKRQTFHRICIRDLRSNPGRTLGMAALCIFLVTMQLVCVFLGTAAFSAYRESVLDADKPDFTLTMNHAGSHRKVEPMLEAVGEMEGLERVDFYRQGRNLFLWYDGMEESPVVQAVSQLGAPYYTSSQSEMAQRVEPGLVTQMIAVEPESELFSRIRAAVTEGTIDPDAYKAGEEVIVLLPMYTEKSGGKEASGDTFAQALRSADRMDFSFDPAVAGFWQKDETVAPGSTLTLGTDSFEMKEENSRYIQNLTQVKVGAVIRTFPDQGIWPFAGELQSHVIIGSRKAMNQLYSNGFITYDREQMQSIDTRSQYFMPTEYGTGVWSLYAAKDASVETTLSPLSRFARQEHLTLHNFMDSKRAVYEKALSSAILAGTLALATTVIVWMILFNTLNAAQEQGRSRTGVLQSLGVTRSQLYLSQALQSLGYWLTAVVISNLILLLTVLISGAAVQAGQSIGVAAALQLALQEGLRGYPWKLHLVLCLAELPVLLLFSLHAARIPMRHSPIENIRS